MSEQVIEIAVNFLHLLQVNIGEKTEIHQCASVGDPHYSTLQANTFGKLVNYL